MLSYRHSFHAGNHADVLKHSILTLCIIALRQKEKPFTYIDTHAGGGIYDLDSAEALKTRESTKGISAILSHTSFPPVLKPYIDICRSMLTGRNQYPGSPELVRQLSRDTDQLILMELHNTEIENLRRRMGGDPRIHIHHRDGFTGLKALSPPEPRRGCALIDPSYETDEDWLLAAEAFISTQKRWSAGTILLWYPILTRRLEEISALKNKCTVSGIPGILCAELLVQPLSSQEDGGWGLAGSGILILNPPWKLAETLQEVLPALSETLGSTDGSWVGEWLNEPL